eukprot:16402310-Heterocapsa_arctica.AAC.1
MKAMNDCRAGIVAAAWITIVQALGSPLADGKRKPMIMQGDFLGIRHDLGKALDKGVVRVWVRGALRIMCAAAMARSKEAGSRIPGQHPAVQL